MIVNMSEEDAARLAEIRARNDQADVWRRSWIGDEGDESDPRFLLRLLDTPSDRAKPDAGDWEERARAVYALVFGGLHEGGEYRRRLQYIAVALADARRAGESAGWDAAVKTLRAAPREETYVLRAADYLASHKPTPQEREGLWEATLSDIAHAVPSCPCPWCDHLFDRATGLGDEAPEPGGVSVCINCGSVNRFRADLTLEQMPEAEWQAEAEPIPSQIRLARRAILQLHANPNGEG